MPDDKPPFERQTYATRMNGTDVPMDGRCGSKLRRSNPPRYCSRVPVPGRRRCYLHGGKTPTGLASPHFKHGMRAKDYRTVLTPRSRGFYEDAVEDPDLLSLRREVALLRAWLKELVADMRVGEGGSWRHVSLAWREFEEATEVGNIEAQKSALMKIRDQIKAGTAMEANRKEAIKIAGQLRQLTESERKHEIEQFQMITAEQAMTYMRAMSLSVRETIMRYVTDAETRATVLTALARRFAELVGRRGTSDLDAGGRAIIPASATLQHSSADDGRGSV